MPSGKVRPIKHHLTDYVQFNAANYADKPAVVFEGQRISWSELWRKTENLSYFFIDELGDSRQRIVALLATNSIDFIIAYLAVLQAGHIVLPIDPAYKRLEIDAIIDRLRPSMIILQERYEDQVGEAGIPKHNLSGLQGGPPAATGKKPLRLAADKQVASITFTSGTSGAPKGVPNTHRNHIWNIEACSAVWDWTADDSLLINLPLSHMHGLVIGLSGAIYHGNTMYLRQQSFDAAAILKELASGRVSIFTHGPIAYMKMLEQPGDHDLSKVRLMISGSAPFPPQLWQDFKHRFGVEVIETYGTSETGRIAANSKGRIMLGSPGRILPGVSAQLSPQGEVLVKSDGLFPGYWRNQQATSEALAAEGFWRTGDIGEIKDGYIFLKGRSQERIRKYGYTVSPRDVEWALLENPSIKEAQVVGSHNPGKSDDKINYFISGDITEVQIADYCKQNLPFSWRPDSIFIVDSLPRTKNGKPDIKTLKEMAANERR